MRKWIKAAWKGLRNPEKGFFFAYLAVLRGCGYRGLVTRRLKCARVRMYLDPRDPGVSRDLLLEGVRERHATRAYRQCLKPGQTVLDLGANIGYYALIAADAVGPTGRVCAVEPEPRNLALLRENVALNHFENRVEIEQGAVSDRNGTGTLHVARQSNLHTLARTPSMKNYVEFIGEVEVPVFTVDSYVVRKGINPADLSVIRMDIEGHEAAALRGMRRTLELAGDLALFVEVHPRIIRESEGEAAYAEFVETLAALGFVVKSAAGKLWSREDRPVEMKHVRDLLQCDRAVGLLLERIRGPGAQPA